MIMVFKDGRIVEKGTHQALLAMNGVYATLTKEQGL
jgi:ABC-type multidrug transport system fused ATPase/permease subunit